MVMTAATSGEALPPYSAELFVHRLRLPMLPPVPSPRPKT
jgi:hypothetical protein